MSQIPEEVSAHHQLLSTFRSFLFLDPLLTC
jgi:hypothetical protein